MKKTEGQYSSGFLFKLNQRYYNYWLITTIFLVVILLEYSTPSAYIFGYFYTGAIVLTNYCLKRQAVILITVAGAVFTLLNLFFPQLEINDNATVANRIIAVIAILVTGWLSVRNRIYEEEINKQQAKIKAQEQLAAIRQDFVSTLTHDLKTPLLGAIETIKSFQAGVFGMVSPTQQKVLEMMRRSHQSTLQLVQTVLDVYRNDSEGIQLQLKPLNLTLLLEEITTTLTDLCQSRRIYIHFDTRQNLWVKGDSLQLQRVFSNLLNNAINHSPRGSRIEITLKSIENQQQVLVRDKGSGIANNDLPYLFERFYQGHSDRSAKGSGLGLYLSRQIIEAHGGKIWAENHPTQGAIFCCSLPALMER